MFSGGIQWGTYALVVLDADGAPRYDAAQGLLWALCRGLLAGMCHGC